MFTQVKTDILATIKAHDTIIIHRHVRPDPDAYGSQAGLRELIQTTYPDKVVYIVGEEDPDLHHLVRMDDVADDVYKQALVIVCDTANPPRISDQRYKTGKKLIKIDHHPNETPYGDIEWVDTSASSTSEMIFELFLQGEASGYQLNAAGARLIYAGIVGDTGRFLFPNTTAKTFKYAADLVQYDFDRVALYNDLYEISDRIARLRGHVLQNFELSESGVCAIRLTTEIIEKFDVTSSETSQLVGTVSEVAGLKAWVFFIEEPEIIRVRIRSKGTAINKLAARFNGGGHALASGASVSSWEEADELVKQLNELCAEA